MPPENTKIGKFKASQMIVKESWDVLNKDKEIMWFPVISFISTLVAILLMGVLFYFVALGGNPEVFSHGRHAENDVAVYGTLLIYYIVVFFIVNFFEAGLFIIVQGRFSGSNLSFMDGLRGAGRNFMKIFYWSLISATVGMILRIISDKSRFIGKIVASIFGAAWGILTYFSLPALVIGNLSIKDSFKESAAIIRKTWGETLIVNFGVGLFFSVLTFILLALSVGTIVLVPTFQVFITVATLFILAMIVMAVISSTLNSIFKLVLFNYARTGQVPQGFSEELVIGAIKK
jgi:hypothetical protein